MTLPAMSKHPNGLTSPATLPDAIGPGERRATLAFAASNVLPHGYSRPSVPRAAFSHSSSVGRRQPAPFHFANSVTSASATPRTGMPPWPAGGLGPPQDFGGARSLPAALEAARNAAHSSPLTSRTWIQ